MLSTSVHIARHETCLLQPTLKPGILVDVPGIFSQNQIISCWQKRLAFFLQGLPDITPNPRPPTLASVCRMYDLLWPANASTEAWVKQWIISLNACSHLWVHVPPNDSEGLQYLVTGLSEKVPFLSEGLSPYWWDQLRDTLLRIILDKTATVSTETKEGLRRVVPS